MAPGDSQKTVVDDVHGFGCSLDVYLHPERVHVSEQPLKLAFDQTRNNPQLPTSVAHTRGNDISVVSHKNVFSPMKTTPLPPNPEKTLYHAVSEAFDIPQLSAPQQSKQVFKINCSIETTAVNMDPTITFFNKFPKHIKLLGKLKDIFQILKCTL